MNTNDLVKAIHYLRPTSEFSFQNNDYSTIKWFVLEGDAPSLAELEIAHQAVKAAEAQAEADKAAAKASAEAKLAALGLTADDLKALGLGGN